MDDINSALTVKNISLVLFGALVAVIVLNFNKEEGSRLQEYLPTAEESQQEAATDGPEEVVDQFLRYTLGTVSDSEIDFQKAAQLMTASFGAKINEPGFIPLTYGIQQGPDRVTVSLKNSQQDSAVVTAEGYYGGEVGRTWEFNLTKVGQEWKIASFEPVF